MSCFVNRMQRKQARRQNQIQQAEDCYVCSKCGNRLFEADKKFDSRTGFPSFWMHIGEAVKENFLDTYGRERMQLLCRQCNQHLGHLFPNKHTPTKVRYCINADAICLEESVED